MMDRIIGALTFKQGVYSEVKSDTSFTQNAWLIVAVTAFLAQLGSSASQVSTGGGIVGWLVATIVGTIFAVGAFALACYVVVFVAKTLFQTTTTFEEMVRVLGLAYIWNIVSFLAIVGIISPALVCAVSPITLIAGLAGLAAFAIALKASLGLEWVQTIVVAIIAMVAIFVVMMIAGLILGILGFGAAAAAGTLR
ncbi:MAG: hypothetical protein JXB07_16855 [Anaerolineae bacterium]|nr:hypothetical protein [Anaerolineae bacterium]